MHIANFSLPNIPTVKIIPTTKDKNAQIVAERMEKKSIENGITFPSIKKITYTVLFMRILQGFLLFEGIKKSRDRVHFSDKKVLLYNTLDYPTEVSHKSIMPRCAVARKRSINRIFT